MTHTLAFHCRCYYPGESKYYKAHTRECKRRRAKWNRTRRPKTDRAPVLIEGIVTGSLLTLGALFVAVGGTAQTQPKPDPVGGEE